MRAQRAILFLSVLAFALAVVPTGRPKAAATLSYKVVAIGTLGGAWSEGNAINSSGVVAATAESTFCPGGPPVCPRAAQHFLDNPMPLDLGAMGGAGSWATAINDFNQVAGGSYFFDNITQHAVRFSPGNGLIDLTPGVSFGRGVDINSPGHVAGYLLGSDNRYHGFIFRDETLPLEDLGTIASAPTLRQIEPLDMNELGEVVGNAYQNLPPNSPGVTHGFLYSGGVMTDLTPNGGWASSINDFGHVTGFENTAGGPRAFLYDNGVKTYLPLPPGGSAAWGYFINGVGQVAGLATVAGTSHAFLYNPATGVSTDIGAPAGPITLKGLNPKGHIVGFIGTGGTRFAFLYADGVFFNLNTVIPAGSGWSLLEARAINDNGQITGVGVFQGQTRGFLLTPPLPPPIARDDLFRAAEDIGTGIRDEWLLQNDSWDPNATGPFTVTFTTQPSHGRLITQSPGVYVYIPDTNYNGQDSFKYKFNDGNADSNEATITIDLPAVNDPPAAVNDSYSTAEDTPVSGNVLSNDSDAEGDPMTAAIVTGPATGTLNFAPNGSFTFTPQANFFGTVTFTYQASDAEEMSAIATVTITVTAVNDSPVANPDGPFVTAENVPLAIAAPGVLGNDTDAETPTNQLTAVRESDPAHGTLALNSDGSFTYTPAPNYNGPDSFAYRASDGQAVSSIITIAISVTAANSPPIATNDAFTTAEDIVLNVSPGGVLSNDSDPDGAPPTIAQLVSGPASGTLDFRTDGSFTYTPAANFSGQVQFSYRASDGSALSAPATVNITVTAVNDAPTAGPDGPYSTAEDTSLTIPAPGLLGNDVDVDTPSSQLTAIKVSDPAHGLLTLNSDGSFSYTPAANYNGPDSFSYRAGDGQALSNVVTITIAVTPIVDPPLARNDFYTVSKNNSGASSVVDNDAVFDPGPVTATVVTPPAHGTLDLRADGTFIYAPASPTSGPDSFTYKVTNGGLASNVATVSVNNACSISWKSASSGRWQDAANWDTNQVPVATDDVCIGLDGAYTVTISDDRSAANVTIASSALVPPPALLIGTASGDASLTVSGDISNSGEIRFDGDKRVSLIVSGVLWNRTLGRINADTSQIARSLTVNLDNLGIVYFQSGETTFTGGSVTNRQSFLNDDKVILNGTTFTQVALNLSARAEFLMTAGTFNFNGGSITGPFGTQGVVTLRDSTLNYNGGGGVKFLLEGASTLTGAIANSGVVTVDRKDGASLIVSGDLNNGGRLEVTGGTLTGAATLSIVAGTLTNTGTLAIDTVGSPVAFSGRLDNQGTVTLGSPVAFTSSILKNRGAFTVAAAVTLDTTTFEQSDGTLMVANGFGSTNFLMTGETFDFTGGTVNAEIHLIGGRLNSNPAAGSGRFYVSGTSILTGAILPGEQVIAFGVPGGTSLTIAGPLVNRGELRLDTIWSSQGSVALSAPSGPLTNAGILVVDGGPAQSLRTLSGDLINQGTIEIRTHAAISGGTYTNNGTISVFGVLFTVKDGTFRNVAPGSISGGGSFDIESSAKFFGTGTITANIRNAGEFNPGLSPGQLNITGSYRQDAPGVFVADINGPMAGIDFDQMTVTNGVVIGSGTTLRVNVAGGGYCPEGTFRIIASSMNGDFSTKTFNNPSSATASASPSGFGYDVTFSGCNPPGDTTPPQLTLPGNLTVEATAPSGAAVTYSATAVDVVDGARPVTCSPTSGSVFPQGTTTVTCSASDLSTNIATGTFTVLVVDSTPPVLSLPGNLTVPATGPSGALVSYNVSATDLAGPASAICNPPSGSSFAIGTTTVNCTATDANGNSASGSFTVSVTAQADTTPPQLTLPANLTAEATAPAGAVVTYTATAVDLVDGPRTVTCSPSSGSTFPLGTTTVTCSASDLSSNTATGTFAVMVVDTTPPVLGLPGNLTVPATGSSGALVTYSVSATDLAGPAPVTCTPASGSMFAIGTTTVNCSARDASGNTSTGSFTVTITNAASQITDLIQLVNSFNLARGFTNSLVQKLQSALDLVNSGKTGACGKLDDFINAVTAQTGQALTQAQATQLIMSAQRVRALLGC